MKYDTIIIGGGLSGLVAGVRLASDGQKVAIITSGQSGLHFSSGSLSLLNSVEGRAVTQPLEAIASLPASHPYSKIGAERIAPLAAELKQLFADSGIALEGSAEKPHYRLTPVGLWEPAWLSGADLAVCDDLTAVPWRKAAIVNFRGYLDFYPEYIADGLKKAGVATECHEVSLPELTRLRKSCSEMRAASIAKILRGKTLEALAVELKRVAAGADVIFLPAVVGLRSDAEVNRLAELTGTPIRYIPVIPMSVSGVRYEHLLRNRFENLGGTYLLGDSVKQGVFEGSHLKAVYTTNLGADTALEADRFILSTGGFFSQGLVAKPDEIIEPVFGLDVVQPLHRTDRYARNFFAPQPYMRSGVATDGSFRATVKGNNIDNLYAIGAILSGADALKEGCGAGIATLTALHVAHQILSLN